MELMTVREVAEEIRVSPMTVRRYIASGTLRAVRVGRNVRIARAAVERVAEPIAPSESDLSDDEQTGVITFDDALWDIIGIARSEQPTDVRNLKDEYLAEATTTTRPKP